MGYDPLDFEGARKLQTWPVQIDYLPGELSIQVEDILQIDKRGRFSGPSRVWLSFDFLVGQSYSLPQRLKGYADKMILDVDEQISCKKRKTEEGEGNSQKTFTSNGHSWEFFFKIIFDRKCDKFSFYSTTCLGFIRYCITFTLCIDVQASLKTVIFN